MGISGKTLVVLGRGDAVAAKAMSNLPEIITIEPGQVTTYDVLWASTVVFTSATLGATEGSAAYVASSEDFVKEDLDDSPTTEEEE
jgi:ribosomal protein L4